VPENYSNNDHKVRVELDTHIKEETIKNSGSSSSKDQQHHSIALGRPRRTIRHLFSIDGCYARRNGVSA